MSETQQRIIGLAKEIVSQDNGAAAHFHVVKAYSVSHIDGTSAVSLAAYVSREIFETGRSQLFFTTIPIPAAPASGRIEDLPTWFALQLLAVAEGGEFVGATPVYAEPVQPEAEEQPA
jgi:hypothetical protein